MSRRAQGQGCFRRLWRERTCNGLGERVRANKGAVGIDGLDIDQIVAWLRMAWSGIREQLVAGTYWPRPV